MVKSGYQQQEAADILRNYARGVRQKTLEEAAVCVNDFGVRKQKEFGLTQHVQDLYRGRDAIRALRTNGEK
jgi:hypothetical protein